MDADFSEIASLGADLAEGAVRVGAQGARFLRRAARGVEADAKQNAPVDTGTMRASIGVDLTGDGRFRIMTAEIGPTVHYAPHVEYGTARQSPQPFMGPAATRAEKPFAEACEQLGIQMLE